jgi:hypothetical protein
VNARRRVEEALPGLLESRNLRGCIALTLTPVRDDCVEGMQSPHDQQLVGRLVRIPVLAP